MIKLSIQLNNLTNIFLLVKVGTQKEREKKVNGYKTLYICKWACVSCSSVHSLIQPLSCFIFLFLFFLFNVAVIFEDCRVKIVLLLLIDLCVNYATQCMLHWSIPYCISLCTNSMIKPILSLHNKYHSLIFNQLTINFCSLPSFSFEIFGEKRKTSKKKNRRKKRKDQKIFFFFFFIEKIER